MYVLWPFVAALEGNCSCLANAVSLVADVWVGLSWMAGNEDVVVFCQTLLLPVYYQWLNTMLVSFVGTSVG